MTLPEGMIPSGLLNWENSQEAGLRTNAQSGFSIHDNARGYVPRHLPEGMIPLHPQYKGSKQGMSSERTACLVFIIKEKILGV